MFILTPFRLFNIFFLFIVKRLAHQVSKIQIKVQGLNQGYLAYHVIDFRFGFLEITDASREDVLKTDIIQYRID